MDKVQAWLAKGAQQTTAVTRFLDPGWACRRSQACLRATNPEKAVPAQGAQAAAEAAAKTERYGARTVAETELCRPYRPRALDVVRGAVKTWTFTEDSLAVNAYGR